MLIDNFEHKFENCAVNAKNAEKNTGNQINSLYTSKNELMEIFRGFLVFEHALW